jgi:hypothetical protein
VRQEIDRGESKERDPKSGHRFSDKSRVEKKRDPKSLSPA